MGKCETSKGIFLIHQCGNDTDTVCLRCGKCVCKEHFIQNTYGTICAACYYDEAYCQSNVETSPQSVIQRFFGEIGNPGKNDKGKSVVNKVDIDNLVDAQKREQYLASLRKSVDSPMIGTAGAIAAAAATPLAVHELFAFENMASELPDPSGGSRGAGFTDS